MEAVSPQILRLVFERFWGDRQEAIKPPKKPPENRGLKADSATVTTQNFKEPDTTGHRHAINNHHA